MDLITSLQGIILVTILTNSGLDLSGSTVGIAYVDRICSDDASLGLTQDGGRSLQSVSSTAAHELGHIFSMAHDGDVGKTQNTIIHCVYVTYVHYGAYSICYCILMA